MEQIIAPTGFCAAAGHMKTAKRMAANDSAGDGSVDIEVPNLETVPHLRNIIRAAGIEPASQSKGGRIRHFDRMRQVAGLMHRQNRSENFFLRDLRIDWHIDEDGGRNEIAL